MTEFIEHSRAHEHAFVQRGQDVVGVDLNEVVERRGIGEMLMRRSRPTVVANGAASSQRASHDLKALSVDRMERASDNTAH
jgi:hypothetical protein